jgi:1,4-dihydroxy-2-naphthoyl-CoA hydrolase
MKAGMSIWHAPVTVEMLNRFSENTMVRHIGIEFTDVGKNYLKAKMPVDSRTIQPAGLLHGGASVTLAETLGSVAAYLCLDPEKKTCVGIEINANHIRSVKSGYVYGQVNPIHIGNSTHIWEIKITNEQDHLVCISRITMAILDK